MSVIAIGFISFGVISLYDTIILGSTTSLYYAIIPVLVGLVLLISCNYFRLVLTETSLRQVGLLWRREVMFNNTLKIIEYGDGWFGLYNDNKKIEIPRKIENRLILVKKLEAKVKQMQDDIS
ncbi:MAG: hypothetical protein IPM69_07950 [Ignavibacteria bacterium]|nr:hypothetical protein [Ignavibacteria bacterium]